MKIIGVRFKPSGKVYYFDPRDIDIEAGDYAIVETIRGLEYGLVVQGPKSVAEEELKYELKPVVRKASPDDQLTNVENKEKEKRAFEICREKIDKHGLDMRLLNVEYTFDAGKIIFYFIADSRVDFRELVKDLAAIFRTRIELRQIGVRDEAKLIGGLGSCGRELCCASWMGDFQPVSIKMAKDQELSLNPTKISGVCGRLMCCLNYEQVHYEDMRKILPRKGSKLTYQNEEARVNDVNYLTGKIQLKIHETQEDVFDLIWIDYADYLNQEARLALKEPVEKPQEKEKVQNLYPHETNDKPKDKGKDKRKRRPRRKKGRNKK